MRLVLIVFIIVNVLFGTILGMKYKMAGDYKLLFGAGSLICIFFTLLAGIYLLM